MNDELESLRSDLRKAKENLRLVQERKLEFPMQTEVSLQYVRQEREWQKKIAELEEEIRKAEVGSGDPKEPAREGGESGTENAVTSRSSRRWWIAIAALALLGIGVALGFLVRAKLFPQSQTPAVSLVGMSYMVGHWDPRRIDLSRVTESGIPVEAGKSLEFVDLAISVPDDAPDYVANIEVYENPELPALVGASESFSLTRGIRKVRLIKPTKYATKPDGNPKENDVWQVPSEWINNPLRVALVVYRRGQSRPVHIETTDVRLMPGGDAWFIDPPNATLASVAYRINDGPLRIADFREVGQKGLDAKPNDTLAIEEIWYTANAGGGTLHAEAYLTTNEYNGETYRSTGGTVASQGTRPLTGLAPLTWRVPANLDTLVLSLVRDDGIVLDRLVMGLNGANGSKGLVPQ